MAITSHPSAAGTLGQLTVLAAGACGVALIAIIGTRLGRRPAGPAHRGGQLAAAVQWLAGLRDAVARRSHPAIAAGIALAAALAAAVLVLSALGLLTRLGVIVHLDRPLDRWVDGHRLAFMSHQMSAATLVGSYPVDYALAVGGGLVIGVLLQRWLPLVVLVAAVLTERVLQSLITRLIHGPRPSTAVAIGPPGGFFSGGSARTLVICGLMAYFLGWAGLVRWQRVLLWTLVIMAAFTEGYSRLYLGRHFVADILGGWAAGALLLAAFAFAAQALRPAAAAQPAAQPAAPGQPALTRPVAAGALHARTGSHRRSGQQTAGALA